MCVHQHRPDPPTLTMIGGSALVGVVLVVSATTPAWGASVVIPSMATWAEALIGTFLVVGAALSLIARKPRRDLTREWLLDEAGMWLTAGGWATYTVVAAMVLPHAAVHWLISATIAAAAVVRIATIRRHRAATERSVARYEQEGGQ